MMSGLCIVCLCRVGMPHNVIEYIFEHAEQQSKMAVKYDRCLSGKLNAYRTQCIAVLICAERRETLN